MLLYSSFRFSTLHVLPIEAYCIENNCYIIFFPPLFTSFPIIFCLPRQLICCYLPSTVVPECQCKKGLEGLTILCTGLSSTQYLSQVYVATAQAVVGVEITESAVDCVDLRDFERFYQLKDLAVTNSKLKDLICPARQGRYHPVINNLIGLRSLDLSNNLLNHMDNIFRSSTSIEQINLANNQLRQISPVISSFKRLKSLDISNNQLSETLDQKIFEKLPLNLEYLDLSG